MKKIALFLALACMAFVLHAQEGPAPEGPKPQKPGKGDKQVPQQQKIVERLQKTSVTIIAMYDADKDGVLNEAEKRALRHDIEVAKKLQPHMREIMVFQKLDTNKNLILEPEEAERIREVMKEMRGPNGPEGMRGPNNGPDGKRGPQNMDGKRGPNANEGKRGPQNMDGKRGPNGPKPPQGEQPGERPNAPEDGEVPPPPPAPAE